jgi:hypothetical protein
VVFEGTHTEIVKRVVILGKSYLIFIWFWEVIRDKKKKKMFAKPGTVASHWQTLSHSVVSSTPRYERVRTHNFSGDRHLTAQVVINPTIKCTIYTIRTTSIDFWLWIYSHSFWNLSRAFHIFMQLNKNIIYKYREVYQTAALYLHWNRKLHQFIAKIYQ